MFDYTEKQVRANIECSEDLQEALNWVNQFIPEDDNLLVNSNGMMVLEVGDEVMVKKYNMNKSFCDQEDDVYEFLINVVKEYYETNEETE